MTVDPEDVEEMLSLTIKEGLRRIKEEPGSIAPHVLDKWISSLSRVWERQQEVDVDPEAAPDVLDTVTSLPKTRARAVLREEKQRVTERLERVNELLEERK